MTPFDLFSLEKINSSEEILDLLIANNIIKEKKFRKQLAYEKELSKLQFELLKLQQYVIEHNKRVLLIFEGRDAAGKGGSISRMIAKLNPKKYRVVALRKPTEDEQLQWYFQRYIKQLPKQGEIVFFDRSWYNRAMVEPVFGFCTKEQYKQFMAQVNEVESLLIEDGIILIKFFLTISKKEQEGRLNERKEDLLKQWKVGPLDEKAQDKWEDYAHYIDKLLQQTSTKKAPWIEVRTDDKRAARLEIIKYTLGHIEGYKADSAIKNDKKIVMAHT
ncbi:polyphosphate kinase 2 [Olivibacter sp. SDN3]|uniref:polyphosphate kinase 2 n=1 Tax=Olivibacter sp. SDN3 TaxID=2764720 RepID=UPI0016515C9C|nr:polyphosphate kinase 2 [Olivibacter sp. SDN3]QNL49030.1 polyphosphate kinase 2 [Olivibacter sp. SDN3]